MKNQKLKIGFIVVLFKTPQNEINRLKGEIRKIGFNDYKIYFIDNTKENRGYAAGVNQGIKKSLIDNCELLIVANPDISLKNLKAEKLMEAGDHFDLWGLSMRMQNKIYYGGKIDGVKLSGGLIRRKPKKRFIEREFVSGSLMFIKKNVIEKTGLFNEEYFMYYEDVDYCVRARKKRFKLGIDSKNAYEHFEVSKNNPQKDIFLKKAHEIFFDKYANKWRKLYRFWTSYSPGKGQNDIRSEFLVNFLSLNVSSVINKLLNFVLFILLIRYLEVKEYGVYTLVWAQISLFSPIVDLGTTSYGIINLPTEKKEKYVTLFNLRLFVSLIVFLLTIISGIIFFRENTATVKYIFLTSFVIFSNMFSGSFLIKNAVNGKLYKSSLLSVFFNSIMIFVLGISIILFKSLGAVFLITFLFYNLYSVVNYYLISRGFEKFRFTINWSEWIALVQKSYIYVLIGFFAGIYFKIDLFLLQYFKGESAVGIYSAGYKFFEALMFLAASYNISRTPVFANLIKQGINKLSSVMKKDILFLGAIGFSLALISYYFSPIILPFFLKSNFKTSITVLRTVMFALPLILINSVFLNALYVLKKALFVISIFLLQSVINVILNIFFIPPYSYYASANITVISELLNTVMLIILFLYIKQKHHENIT